MNLHWNSVLEDVGIGFGYTMHQKNLRAALQRQGVEITNKADVAVSVVPAHVFQPAKGKYNVLYTMYESTEIPDIWPEKLKQADLIVVPCEHNKKLFSRYAGGTPIEVCWEGVDVKTFSYHERKFPDVLRRACPECKILLDPEQKKCPQCGSETDYQLKRRFTYLWFGATNERKGYKHMIIAWQIFRAMHPEIDDKVQLVMKTTQNAEKIDGIIGFKNGEPIYQDMPRERVFTADNVTVDTRKLPLRYDGRLQGLREMYHWSHCFVFPSMGEGFGLTLAEAMATGLPCIYTPWSGPKDFISSKEGYPLKFRMAQVFALDPSKLPDRAIQLVTHAASADVEHIARRMYQVYMNYEKALEKGRLASERINKYITWDRSAQTFMDIIRRYAPVKEGAA